MSNKPFFSVILPSYKVADYLEDAVSYILNQTFEDFELILVDDGSQDHCPEMCDAFAEKDPRVRVIHKPNGGLVSARNAGIMEARGDYICYVDGDDWIKPNLLAFVFDRLAGTSVPLDMVIFAADKVAGDQYRPFLNGLPEGLYDRERLKKEVFPYLISDRRNGFHTGSAIKGYTWNKVSRRALQLEHYVRDERIRMFTDVPLTYEILLNCQNVYICNERLYLYNVSNPNSILARGKQDYLTPSFRYLISYMNERLRGYGPEIDRELNDYPATLIIRTVKWRLKTAASFREAVYQVKMGLKASGMLEFISLKGLPMIPMVLILLLKLHLYNVAMAFCALRMHCRRR
ncbi:MAG: glycosyltransferase family 2 protein [Oscillospiraceae bacterium]|nr:glycosyltransferase family 2 protein [Oscillospiraceae bacterium]